LSLRLSQPIILKKDRDAVAAAAAVVAIVGRALAGALHRIQASAWAPVQAQATDHARAVMAEYVAALMVAERNNLQSITRRVNFAARFLFDVWIQV
jgi:hypothetical protein